MVRHYNEYKQLMFYNHKDFSIVEKDGMLKPEFNKEFHASGHASKSDFIQAIETIDLDYIIPIHTANPNWVKEHFDNARLLMEGEKYIL